MDTPTHMLLGAAIAVAVVGRRAAPWKPALWGAIGAGVPDLDLLINHGDAISNMTRHRAETHSLFWLTLASPALAWLSARIHRDVGGRFPHWWFAIWLAMISHPLLDWLTVYGTQLLLPFDGTAYGLGSVFVIDLLVTLPLAIGLIGLWRARETRRYRWNAAGLAIALAYLGWSVAAQAYVTGVARDALAARGTIVPTERILVTPTPLNTVLWRIVVLHDDAQNRFYEGFYSLLDPDRHIPFEAFDRGLELRPVLEPLPPVRTMQQFTDGFYKLGRHANYLTLTDLRMGQEPHYVFRFSVARKVGDRIEPVRPDNVGGRQGDVRAALSWLWRRILGDRQPPPWR
ncbi:MAG TPA: metal-dependent hydrolase [Burkholderiaceae bacterium]|jgi:inner membrane protein|nr:metal-dependent hydrolase [Burkholderiaceae bacterium]